MGWFVRERRGVSWTDQTLDSISAPPLPLLLFFGLFMMLMYLASYAEFKERVERSRMGFRFALLLLPLAAVLVGNLMVLHRRWWRYGPRAAAAADDEGSWPWGLLMLVGLLLAMLHFQSSFKSAWFRSF